jgi:hypothetical protein
MLLMPDVGEIQMLTMFLKDNTTIGNQTLKLFVNDKTPAEGDTAASYTEMSTHGYAAKTLTRANWSVATVEGVSTASYAQQTWSFTAASVVTVYGYFVVDAVTGILLWAEKFSNSQAVESTGDEIRVTPKITLD